MTVGVEIFSDSGSYAICDVGFTFALRNKWAVTLGANSPLYASNNYQVTIGLESCLAVACSSPVAVIPNGVDSNGNCIWSVESDSAASCTIYEFGRPVPNTSGLGLEVYDESGNCCFASDRPALRIVQTFSGTFLNTSTWEQSTQSVDAGSSTIAFLFFGVQKSCKWSSNSRAPATIPVITDMGAVSISGSTVTSSSIRRSVAEDNTPALTSAGTAGTSAISGLIINTAGL